MRFCHVRTIMENHEHTQFSDKRIFAQTNRLCNDAASSFQFTFIEWNVQHQMSYQKPSFFCRKVPFRTIDPKYFQVDRCVERIDVIGVLRKGKIPSISSHAFAPWSLNALHCNRLSEYWNECRNKISFFTRNINYMNTEICHQLSGSK